MHGDKMDDIVKHAKVDAAMAARGRIAIRDIGERVVPEIGRKSV